MNAQELLDALNKVPDKSDLEPTALGALSEYLQEAWKDRLDKSVRPFDLGKALGDFFVDLSQHRLSERITNLTPETEPILLKFFGAAEGSLSQFWRRCVEIWSVTLKPHPAYAKQVKKYFDMLLQSSLQDKPAEPPVVSIPASAHPSIDTSTTAPLKPLVATEKTRVQGSKSQENAPEPPGLPPTPKTAPAPMVFPRSAYLVLQGTRVIPLNQPVVTIGRRLDNHIILEDPRVSRSHAEIKLINDRFVIFDLDSTGGTFINGRRTSQSVLYPGDTISLAGVMFIYSQELPAKPGEVKIIELGSPLAADRPTAVMRKEGAKPAERISKKDMAELPKTKPLLK